MKPESYLRLKKKKIKDQNHENSRIENPNFHNPKSCSSSFKPLITLIQYYKKKNISANGQSFIKFLKLRFS